NLTVLSGTEMRVHNFRFGWHFGHFVSVIVYFLPQLDALAAVRAKVPFHRASADPFTSIPTFGIPERVIPITESPTAHRLGHMGDKSFGDVIRFAGTQVLHARSLHPFDHVLRWLH